MISAKALLVIFLVTFSGMCMSLSSFNPFKKEKEVV